MRNFFSFPIWYTPYGSEKPDVETSNDSLFYKLESEWVSKRTNGHIGAHEQTKQCIAEPANKWAAWLNKQMDEQVSLYIHFDS